MVENTFSQGTGKAVTVGLGVITTMLLTRYLGPGEYGNYLFAITFFTFFAVLANWGTDLITVREAASREKEADKILGNMFLVRGILGIMAAITGLVLLVVLDKLGKFDAERIPLLVIFGLILTTMFKDSGEIVFKTFLKMRLMAITEILASLITFVLIGFFIWQKFGMEMFLWAILIGQIMGAGFCFWRAGKIIKLDFKWDWQLIKKILRETLPMGGILILFTLYTNLDRFMLQAMQKSEALGFYGTAYKIQDVLVLGAAYLMNSLLPIFSRATIEERKELYARAFWVLAAMAVIVWLGVQIFAPLMIKILAGESFAASVLALRLLSFATVMSYFNHLTGFTLIAIRRQGVSFWIAIISLSVNFLINLYAIPRFSFYGAAGVTFLTELTTLLLTSVALYRAGGLRPRFSVLKVLIRDVIEKRGLF